MNNDWADDTAADAIRIAFGQPDAREIIAQMFRLVYLHGRMKEALNPPQQQGRH